MEKTIVWANAVVNHKYDERHLAIVMDKINCGWFFISFFGITGTTGAYGNSIAYGQYLYNVYVVTLSSIGQKQAMQVRNEQLMWYVYEA